MSIEIFMNPYFKPIVMVLLLLFACSILAILTARIRI